MSKDLLPQLRESAGVIASDHIAVDLPPEAGGAGDTEGDLDAYYEIIVKVDGLLQAMKTHTTELNQVHNKLHVATSDASKKELRQTSSRLHEEFSAESQAVKTHLDKMEEFIKGCQARAQQHPAELRIQENQYMLKRQEFVQALTAFQEVEQSNKEKYKDTIVRRIKTKFSSQQLGDEQVAKMADEVILNGTESAIFSSNQMSVCSSNIPLPPFPLQNGLINLGKIFSNCLHPKKRWHCSTNLQNPINVYSIPRLAQIAATTLEEVAEMRMDIQKIESALKALHQMFLDMAVLVHEQGQLINDIRDNVGKYVNISPPSEYFFLNPYDQHKQRLRFILQTF